MSEKSPDGAPFLLRFLHDLWRRAVPVAIGLFFLWQFWHMLVDNLTHMEETTVAMLHQDRKNNPDKWDRVRAWPDGKVVDNWGTPPDEDDSRTLELKHAYERSFHRWYGQALAQEQSWSLFAPDVGTSTNFVAVQLRWDDPTKPQREWLEDQAPPPAPVENVPLPLPGGPPAPPPPVEKPVRAPVLILSDNEPRDIHAYLRIGHFRTRRYEGQLVVPMSRGANESRQGYLDRWTERIRSKARQDGDCMHAYLRARLRLWQAQNPDAPPPTQVVLLGRTWIIPEPPGPQPWDWEFQGMRPIGRWLPGEKPDPNYLPLERYLPSSGFYQKMEK